MNKLSRLSPEDVLSFRNVSDAQISPDGERVAFVVGDAFKSGGKLARSNIWMAAVGGGEPQPFTRGCRADLLPRWSPDGNSLAFLSDRREDGRLQIYLIPAGGGEATAVAEVKGAIPTPRGLNARQWSADGSHLSFLMEDPQTQEERCRQEDGRDAIEFERNPRFVRVWTVDVESGALESVSPEGLQIWEFARHPGGDELAAVVSEQPYEWGWYGSRLVSIDRSGAVRALAQTDRQVALPCWSPDGARLAFVSSTWSDRGCASGDVWIVDPEGDARNLCDGLAASLSGLSWSAAGDALYSIGHDCGGTALYRFDVDRREATQLWWRQAAVAEAFAPAFTRSAAGTFAVVLEDADHPRDVWIARGEEFASEALAWKQLSQLQPQTERLRVGRTEVFRWSGADEWEMQGLLIRPVDAGADAPVPLVMNVHGGPTGVSGSRYNAAFGWNQLLANAGCAVFMPNYRGSVGWGRGFSESNLGDMGGRDFEDMMRGIDALVDAGVADPERLAITGWSYGGFIAAWAVSQTDRFKAAVMGAGISHWVSFHGKSCLAAWDELYYRCSPYEREGPYQDFSPVHHWERLNTPTLILHGEQDPDVPVEQGCLFFRALQDKGVPSELVVYPREGHGIAERAHVLDMSCRVLDWLGRYLEL